MNIKYDMIIGIGMCVSVMFAISTIVSYVISQNVSEIFVSEIFTGAMNFCLVGTVFSAGVVAICHILSIVKPTKRIGD